MRLSRLCDKAYLARLSFFSPSEIKFIRIRSARRDKECAANDVYGYKDYREVNETDYSHAFRDISLARNFFYIPFSFIKKTWRVRARLSTIYRVTLCIRFRRFLRIPRLPSTRHNKLDYSLFSGIAGAGTRLKIIDI